MKKVLIGMQDHNRGKIIHMTEIVGNKHIYKNPKHIVAQNEKATPLTSLVMQRDKKK